MAEINISFKGKTFKDLADALGKTVPRKNREVIKETLDFSLDEISSFARLYCPVRTGHLRSSIQVVRFSDFEGMVEAFAEYALYVEQGTSRMRPKPFLRPAWMSVWPFVLQMLKEKLNDKIQEALK